MEQADPKLAAFMSEVAASPMLAALFGNSPFLSMLARFEPATLRDLAENGPDAAFEAILAGLADDSDRDRMMRCLRIAKRRVALVAGMAEIGRIWTIEQSTLALSRFAGAAVRFALRCLLLRANQRGEIGLADPADPEAGCGLVVLGMGKLGAFELNYSSDIDLIVFYDPAAISYTGSGGVSEWANAATKDLARMLETRTVDGYVFRTDLRLRPDPGAMPVAVTIAAAEAYYEAMGQTWERAAMIKARALAGDAAAIAQVAAFLRPFVWRKSLDFAALREVRSLKRKIDSHRAGKAVLSPGHDIKLGRGGIREIEFFVQTQQLIWGGRQPALRTPATVEGLARLKDAGLIDGDTEQDLKAAYRYLRTVEHRLQMIDDRQTQTLPADPARFEALAIFLGYGDGDAFRRDLGRHLAAVERHWSDLFEDDPARATGPALIFDGAVPNPDTLARLTEMGFTNAQGVAAQVQGWHAGRLRATRSEPARELVTELTPALLAALATARHPDDAFMRFDEFLGGLPMGVPLFSLFAANPPLMTLVAGLMGDAPRLAQHLARHPTVLYGVLGRDFHAALPSAAELAADLDAVLADTDNDQGAVLDAARRWTNDRRFQVGVHTLQGWIDPSQAGQAFADIADCVTGRMARLVEQELAAAYGAIPGGEWCVIGMGKMGGREMTATSDLDLILIYDAPPEVEDSAGPRALPVSTWFARFTARLVTALTAQTGEGALYEVDMRLRPSGNKGPIATSLESFRRYQAEAAWTWEHMALTRARVVAGDAAVTAKVEAAIHATLATRRDPDKLKADVADMRRRMAETHKAKTRWEVKYWRGGLVDIEFVVQYLQLAHAREHPEILERNTGAALARLSHAGCLTQTDSDALETAWRLCSAVQMVLRQTLAGDFNEATAPAGVKDLLARAAGVGDFRSLGDRLEDCTALAFEVFERVVENPPS